MTTPEPQERIVTRSQLDEMRCPCERTDCRRVAIHNRCHPTTTIRCAKCDAVTLRVRIAGEA